MRPFVAAIVGGVAGAAAALAVSAALRSKPGASVAPDDEVTRLRARVERLERAASQRTIAPGTAGAMASAPSAEATAETNGRDRPDPESPPAAETPPDLSKVPTADLALEADERHARDFDIAGAAKRYRELLARSASPADRPHKSMNLRCLDSPCAHYRSPS